MKKISAFLTALVVSFAALTPNFAAASEISSGTNRPTPGEVEVCNIDSAVFYSPVF